MVADRTGRDRLRLRRRRQDGADVKQALVDLYCAKKNASAAQGETWIAEMGATNRYVLDVWAGG